MTEESAKNLRTQIILTILTLFVSPLLSVGVVSYQLTLQDKITRSRATEERRRLVTREKINLQQVVMRDFTEFRLAATTFMMEGVYMMSRDDPKGGVPRVIDSLREVVRRITHLESQLEFASILFGKEVKEAVDAYRELEVPYPQKLPQKPTMEFVQGPFKKAMETYEDAAQVVIAAMGDEISAELHNDTD